MNIKRSFWFGYYLGTSFVRRGTYYLFYSMLLPISILFLFGLISGGSLLKYAILGGFISIIAANALSTMIDAAEMRLDTKFQDLLVATKMDPLEFMGGIGMSNFIYSIPALLVYLVIALIFGIFTLPSFIITVVILMVLSIAATTLGFIFSYIPSHFRNIYGLNGIVSTLLTIIPPIFYPYSILPKPLLYAFALSPVTSASVLIQNVVGFEKFGPVSYIMIVVLLLETIIFAIAAKRLIKWRQP